MEKLDLRWAVFEYCNIDKTKAFENMCRRMFTEEFLKGKTIPHSDHKTPGIEVIPVLEPKREDGKPSKLISFQSKYHGNVSDAYRKFKESAEITVKKWQGRLDLVYLFSNRTLTTESSNYKEIVSILSRGGIEAVPISDTDLLDLAAKYPNIAKDYFVSKSNNAVVPPALTTIPAPPEKLIGREKAIEEIQGLLAQNKIVYIHAHGGVGKTAVAAQIASRINDGDGPYKHTAWIISTGNLKADLIGLNIPGVSAKQTPEENYKIVSTFLQTTPTFLVIDNMYDPPVKEINELNTISGRTKILITSRANISIGKPYELEDLDSDSALLLFYWYFRKGKNLAIDQINKQEDKSYAQNIVEAATYNALFIELIAKMAYADHWKLDALWKELEKDIFCKNSRHKITAGHGDDGRLLAHIQELYEMSGLSGRQKEIMSFFSMFPAEHSIFFDVFEWAGFEDDEVDNLGELERRGWIERGNDGYLIHKMVKGSIEQQGKVVFDEDKHESLINNLADTDQYMSVDRGYTVIRERIVIPETICKLLANQGSEKIITSTLFNNIAGVYRVLGNYAEALKYYNLALSIREEKLGKDHPSTATTYNNIAGVYKDQGNYAEALKYYNLALSIREEKLGKEDPDTATTYNNIAGVYKDQGNYVEALKYYNLALSIREEKSGKDHLDTATTYQNIALVYSAQGNYAKALEFYKQALSIREEKSGKDHLDTAVIYHNIAGVYKAQGNYVEALKYYNQALSIRKEKLIRAHPDTAMTYNNIAGVYRAQGNYAEALKYYNLALSIREEKLGKEHPDTATTYNNIAGVYEEQGKYAEALRYFNEALSIYVEKLEKDHPYIATIYNNMALVNSALGNYAEALQLYNLALSIREGKLGKDHPSTATTYNNIGRLYEDQSNYEEALKYHDIALSIREEKLGKDHPSTATTYNNIGRAYAGLGNYAEAMNYYSLALSIREKKLGKDHPFTAATYNNIGRAYAGLGNYAEAMNYYSHALSIHEKKLGKDHPSTATTYDNMGVLYYQMHDYEKAKDYLERAMVIREKVLGPVHPYTKNTKESLELVQECRAAN